MAPLLGRKPFPLGSRDVGSEFKYKISHTGEVFSDKDEFDERVAMYAARNWTCRSTGSSALTHQEAWEEEQEVQQLLAEEYPTWFEQPVLQLCQHSMYPLERLVNEAYTTIMTRLALGEICEYKVGSKEPVPATIEAVYPIDGGDTQGAKDGESTQELKEDPATHKEGQSVVSENANPTKSTLGNQATSNAGTTLTARRSPRKLPTSMNKPKEKQWVPPRLLPHSYDIRLQDGTQVKMVPGSELLRSERPPTKEIMRYFIRHHGARAGYGDRSPWVVDQEAALRFSLVPRLNDEELKVFYCPRNVGQCRRRKANHSLNDRSSLSSLSSTCTPSSSCRHVHLNGASPSHPLSGSETSSELTLAEIIARVGSGKGVGDVKKKKKKYSEKTEKENEVNKRKKQSYSGKDRQGKMDMKQKPRVGKCGTQQETGKVKDKKQQLRQLTLMEAGVQHVGGLGSKRRKEAGLAPAALRLLRFYQQYHDRTDKRNTLSHLLTAAAKELGSEGQRAIFPAELRAMVERRCETLAERHRLAIMSAEEREAVVAQRREKAAQKIRERAREKRRVEMEMKRQRRQRVEDLHLNGTPGSLPLPQPFPIHSSIGLSFGDIAMVTDFFNCYDGLLTVPKNESWTFHTKPITAQLLTETLVSGASAEQTLGHLLAVLLGALLWGSLGTPETGREGLRCSLTELGFHLSDLPIDPYIAPELARLCLRRTTYSSGSESDSFSNGVDDDIDNVTEPTTRSDSPEKEHRNTGYAVETLHQHGKFDERELSSELLLRLETSEFWELDPRDKLSVLQALCHRLLVAGPAQDYVDSLQRSASDLWKDRIAMQKQQNDRRREEKEQRKKDREAGQTAQGKKDKAQPSALTETGHLVNGGSGALVQVFKSQRLLGMKMREKEKEAEAERLCMQKKEAEAANIIQQRQVLEKAFQEGVTRARLVCRRIPLGTDRYHSRYWLFSESIPGLFVETGWAAFTDYTYSTTSESPLHSQSDEDSSSNEAELEGTEGDIPQNLEKTFPPVGANKWFLYASERSLHALVASLLPQGIRESNLRETIIKRWNDILSSVQQAQKQQQQQHSSLDLNPEVNNVKPCSREALCTQMREVGDKLCNSQLGQLANPVEWEQQIGDAWAPGDFADPLLALQAAVLPRYLRGTLGGGSSSTGAESNRKTGLLRWRVAVREAMTFSRLHFLLAMLNACVDWGLSAKLAHCRVCRGKGDDNRLLAVCEICRKAFHVGCLRPALLELPDGPWHCPGCQPQAPRRTAATPKTEEGVSSDEEVESASGSEDKEPLVIGGLTLRPRKVEKGRRGQAPYTQQQMGQRHEGGSNSSRWLRSKPPPPPTDTDTQAAEELARCEAIANRLLRFRYSQPFRRKSPPSLSSIASRCRSSSYSSACEFLKETLHVLAYRPASGHRQVSMCQKFTTVDMEVAAKRTGDLFRQLVQHELPRLADILEAKEEDDEEEEEEEEEEGSCEKMSETETEGESLEDTDDDTEPDMWEADVEVESKSRGCRATISRGVKTLRRKKEMLMRKYRAGGGSSDDTSEDDSESVSSEDSAPRRKRKWREPEPRKHRKKEIIVRKVRRKDSATADKKRKELVTRKSNKNARKPNEARKTGMRQSVGAESGKKVSRRARHSQSLKTGNEDASNGESVCNSKVRVSKSNGRAPRAQHSVLHRACSEMGTYNV
uniref:Bromodomain adjacent to zinc finger domain protein 1A n=2 Tax=Eptatretus burgeri TaxID=7764 RepID=A0A8C4NBM9_EPTBU